MRTISFILVVLAVCAVSIHAIHLDEQNVLSADEQYITPKYNEPTPKPVSWIHSAYSGPKANAHLRAIVAAKQQQQISSQTVAPIHPNIIKPKIVKKLKPKKIKDLFDEESRLVLPVTVPQNHTHFRDHDKREGNHSIPFSHRPLITKPGTVLPAPLANKPTIASPILNFLPPNPKYLPTAATGAAAPRARKARKAAKAAAKAAAAAAGTSAAPAAGTAGYDAALDPKSPQFDKARYDWENRMRRMFGANWKNKLINAQQQQKRVEAAEKARQEQAKQAAQRRAAAAAQKK